MSNKIVIAIHGFGSLRHLEMQYLKEFYENTKIEYLDFDLYEMDQIHHIDFTKWFNRAFEKVKEQDGKEIYLIGFSMGGVIAFRIAQMIKIKKLVLIAPAFKYISVKNTLKFVDNSLHKHLTIHKKIVMPPNYIDAFISLVNTYRKDVKTSDVNTLLIHGTSDEVIDITSSYFIMKYLSNSRLEKIDMGNHVLLLNETTRDITIRLIDEFVAK